MNVPEAMIVLRDHGVIKELPRRDGSVSVALTDEFEFLVQDSQFSDRNVVNDNDRIGFLGMLLSAAAARQLDPASLMAVGLAQALQDASAPLGD